MAHLLETDRGGVLARRPDRLAGGLEQRYAELVSRRSLREPLQHLTGVQEFYGLEFRVDRHVFIPRPETEGLVDAVLSAGLPEAARVLDLGTGSGCIAVALAASRSDLRLCAVERSAEALPLARANIERHGLGARVELTEGDLHELPAGWEGRFHALVSNPPYVPERDWATLQPEVRDFEPRAALVPGPTGLEAYEAIVPAASRLLRPEGLVALEIGLGQGEAVGRILAAAGFADIEIRPDLNGIDRVALARRPAPEPRA